MVDLRIFSIFLLFKCSHAEIVHLFLGEIAPAAAGKVFLGEACEIDAVELRDAVAEVLEDAAHDAVAARVDFDAGLVAVVADIADGVGVDLSVVELDSVGDALHVFLGDVFVGPDVIDFLLHEFRMGELRCEVAVIGQKEHAGGVAVEAAYGVDALLAGVLDDVEHSGASVGIIAGGDAVFRLVEKHVAFAFGSHDLFIVFHHVVAFDLCSEFGHDFAVDLHFAGLDEFVGLAAGADAGVGHIFVKTDFCLGIDVLKHIVDLLGTRDEFHALSLVVPLVVAISALTMLAVAMLLAVLVVSSLTALAISALLTVLTVAALLALLAVAALLTVLAVAALLTLLAISALLTVLTVAALLTVLTVAALLALLAVSALLALLAVAVRALLAVSALLTLLAIAVRALLAVAALALLAVAVRALLAITLALLIIAILAGLIARGTSFPFLMLLGRGGVHRVIHFFIT